MNAFREISSKISAVKLQNRVIALFALVMMTIPLGIGPYPISAMVDVGLYSIVTIGIILLMGFAGQISIGHAAFFGIGAYTSAILTTHYQFSPWLALFLGTAISGGIAAAIGRAMFRLHGLMLAGITLALNLVFYHLVCSMIDLTGGAMGLINIPPLMLGGFNFSRSFLTYYMVWIIAIVILGFSLNLADSQVGRALRSMNTHAGGSEDAAQVLGINVNSYKVQIFALSAVYASIAGSIYAHHARVVEPGTFFIPFSVMVVIMALLGGLRSPWGAFLGASLMIGVRELLWEVMPVFVTGVTGAYELIAYGVILILALLFLPRGLISLFGKAFTKRRTTV